jgi:phosphatidylinositol alpha-1,6-mannosyltransferase
VFALPSRGEGFGLVYLEAMAHGLPCVGSIHDAAAEIVVDGETGLLVDSSDPRALRSGLARLLADADLRHRFGAAGRRRLRAEFSYSGFRTRVRDLIECELERRPLRAA